LAGKKELPLTVKNFSLLARAGKRLDSPLSRTVYDYLENKTSRFPLPRGERLTVRGNSSKILSTDQRAAFGLTLALSRQRERG